jgi:hypothetical protein
MAFEAQIDKLIDKLTELTRADKIAWQDTADENAFLTAAGNSTVVVGGLGSDPAAPCFIRVLDGTGKTVEEAFAFSEVSPPTNSVVAAAVFLDARDRALREWDRLRTLHELARRSALKSEKVVSDLLSSLEAIK